jgi:phosphonate transport system ATP-binding protein
MQRVSIARAIHQRPLIYLADEPISSLDPKNAEAIMGILQPLSRETPVIGAFHQPVMVAKYCTRALGIHAGKVVYDGSPQMTPYQLESIYSGSGQKTLIPMHEPNVKPPFFGPTVQPSLQQGVPV